MARQKPLEDYGYIGNMLTGALVARDGSMDWLCLPRFDSDACFAALLGTPDHGRWQIAPVGEVKAVSRRYRPGTAILETTFETDEGAATLIDLMLFSDDERFVEVMRLVRGERGRVRMRMDLAIRFGYGRTVPWVRRHNFGISAVAGPDALRLYTPIDLEGKQFHTVGGFTVEPGALVPFTLSYHPSHCAPRSAPDFHERLESTAEWWEGWSSRCAFPSSADERWHDAVVRSLITLKAMIFAPTGGIVAAPTTSLPEHIGGERNWDYRICWIRDSTLALYALLDSGYRAEARAWRAWLLRAVAGDPTQLQIMYGLSGERRLTEFELPWLPGYEGSRPVRLGNAASTQLQLDVTGELMDTLHVARSHGIDPSGDVWRLQLAVLENLAKRWMEPDEGIWEVRGGRRHFTHSRVMCWVAFDRAIKAVEEFGLEGPVDDWRALCEEIHADVCRNGWNEDRGAFVQYYGGSALDASLLLMAEVGFLPPEDSRFVRTVAAIEQELMVEGLVIRYRPEDTPDGFSCSEGAFVACSFWLVDAYVMLGRHDDAVALFERLLSIRNDLGLLAEEYDPREARQLGNFPQAFSHIALINSACNLISAVGPARQRAGLD